MKTFTFYKQQDQMDCGATCLRMIIKHYGRSSCIQKIRELCQINRNGASLLDISDAAEKLGFRTHGIRLSLEQLSAVELPCILHWRQNHFVVLYKIKKGRYYIADPSTGMVILDEVTFKNNWFAHKELFDGTSLLLLPSPQFYEDGAEDEQPGMKWHTVFRYFYTYRRLFSQLALGLLVNTLFQLMAPFLTQAVVDVGINSKNLHFIYLILIAQLMLFVGQLGVSFIQSWIMLHVSTRVNISILTDLLIKMMKLPMAFFETKTTGDIMQRMNDQRRIEGFITGSTLNTLFSMVNLVIFSIVLIYYNLSIFLLSLFGTLLYAGWILLFMETRRKLDYKNFNLSSENQTTTIEMISSMQEIKLNNSEKQKRWVWENVQARLFKLKVKGLVLSQYQQAGSMAINQAKNILIVFLSAKAVIDGNITLGGMMAIQYIVGMVSNPIEQLLGFFQSYQDAKISLERVNEIFESEEEEPVTKEWLQELPLDKTINIGNLNFSYPGAGNPVALDNIQVVFPEGKTTAIVGMSGSGKTTMLKMIMRYYEPANGEIRIGSSKLNQIAFKCWRKSCGVVMQDGFIFSDTIENNIAVGDELPDKERIRQAIMIANLNDFINEQPFGLKTKIGISGKGISQGQKQRLLIARAVYKTPDYLFFDEATNALDANNERIIMDNLYGFFSKRTVIIVAHRLSTVKYADHILVMDKGKIVESGNHKELTEQKGLYYQLIKNQLEMGN